MPTLYAYVLRHDHGFAPNPFYGTCTLATCKPRIRREAKEGDWVVGTSSSRYADDSFDLVYAMKVTEEPLRFEAYSEDQRFQRKKPQNGDWKAQRGDNIYYRSDGSWRQRDNPFHGDDDTERDLGGEHVLVSTHFAYFGQDRIRLPAKFEGLARATREGRGLVGENTESDPKRVEAFVTWLEGELADQGLDWGRIGDPHDSDFKEDWQESRGHHSCGEDV